VQASARELGELGIVQAAREYLQAPDWQRIKQDQLWLEKPGNQLITLFDDAYPALLREIAQAPPLIFAHGDSAVLSEPQIAIVGTRQPTSSGQQLAEDFAAHLAKSGIVITSGLALGIDAAAHRGALAAQDGRTVAVMATGLDRVYPARHRDLAHAIVQQGGVLISEFPPGTPALAEHFPRRNRIISGLSLGTLVVEAAVKSGSLITARLAAEQGREVFAIPGSVHNPVARGCHSLIRQGAKLVETAADIIEELGPLASFVVSDLRGKTHPKSTDVKNIDVKNDMNSEILSDQTIDDALDPDYRRLLALLDNQATAIDALVERSGLTVESVSSMLLILELQGYVTAVPGGLYARVEPEDD
jgi:DNA processing protein